MDQSVAQLPTVIIMNIIDEMRAEYYLVKKTICWRLPKLLMIAAVLVLVKVPSVLGANWAISVAIVEFVIVAG